jgi:hypothetical protein
MYELPDEIWSYILEFTLDWKRTHKQKFKLCVSDLDFMEGKNDKSTRREIYVRWTLPPPVPQNTNDIIRDEYIQGIRDISWAPPPNLELTSITWNPNANENGGWWCGYGWKKVWWKHAVFYEDYHTWRNTDYD